MFYFSPRFRVSVCVGVMLWGVSGPAQTSPPPAPNAQIAPTETEPKLDSKSGGITEDELKQRLAAKTFYLRGGYLDNTLEFNEHGRLAGHSPTGSYTLSLIQVDKVRLTKHSVELTGIRYGLHFLGSMPRENPSSAMDRVRITPKKKQVRITIDRELVVTLKKKKDRGKHGGKVSEAKQDVAPKSADEASAASEAERPADANGATTTTSPAHAKKVLEEALDSIFASTLDKKLIATLPDFWKLYYQAADAQKDYTPSDPAVLLQSQIDRKARLSTPVEPPSNEYAQAAGVAGMALYHAVVGADGKPREVVVGRPIGFGLDENAADAILKASFEPALKDGKPVPVLVDLVVQFRIYSNRTSQPAKIAASSDAAPVKLPGPYSLQP